VTSELQKYYEERFSMMATEGWSDLMVDIDAMIAGLNSISGIENEKQLHFKRGELSILLWLKTLQEASAKTYEDLQLETHV